MSPILGSIGGLSAKAYGFCGVSKPSLSGGTLTSDSTYYYRTFTSSSNLTIQANKVSSMDVLVASGGGGGLQGQWNSSLQFYLFSGGGGAGGTTLFNATNVNPGVYTVTVGAGGTTAGSPSSFSSYSTLGGGGSGDNTRPTKGSGGGGTTDWLGGTNYSWSFGYGTSGQGYNGGTATGVWPAAAGGGGGAGGLGGNGSIVDNISYGGAGGTGYSNASLISAINSAIAAWTVVETGVTNGSYSSTIQLTTAPAGRIYAGMSATGTNIPSGTFVTSVNNSVSGATIVGLSQNRTGTVGSTVTFKNDTYIAGGGGGGCGNTLFSQSGAGGYGGGGESGTNTSYPSVNGLANTGGGGGGSGATGNSQTLNQASGGSGLVVFRYLKTLVD
jgi:hypothetical protein